MLAAEVDFDWADIVIAVASYHVHWTSHLIQLHSSNRLVDWTLKEAAKTAAHRKDDHRQTSWDLVRHTQNDVNLTDNLGW